MNEFDKLLQSMDFRFFGTGQHKIDAESFLKKENSVLLDVRSHEETATIKLSLIHHCQVLEVPIAELPGRFGELPQNKFIGIFCSSGVRSAIAFAYLKTRGLENVRMIEGGYAQFMDALMPGKVFKQINQ
jgi:rhodanese-related sulfurtransferase